MFDRVIVVDWSANATPKLGADSIWIAVHGTDASVDTRNVSTRREAEAVLAGLIDDDTGPATLLGVDFSLGYPEGTAELWGVDDRPAWSGIWTALESSIRDGPRNANNRFEVASALNARGGHGCGAGPFWGGPPSRSTPWLTSTNPERAVAWPAQWRLTEAAMRHRGHRPFDCWQLLGAGSVGSQSLTGIPMLERLRRRFGQRVQVWPFSTGVGSPSVQAGSVVIGEVWPSLQAIDLTSGTVRDERQVIATARWLAAADRDGALESMFDPSIDSDRITAVVTEEGWVLGVGAPTADQVVD